MACLKLHGKKFLGWLSNCKIRESSTFLLYGIHTIIYNNTLAMHVQDSIVYNNCPSETSRIATPVTLDVFLISNCNLLMR
jgi:hypothetical protein